MSLPSPRIFVLLALALLETSSLSLALLLSPFCQPVVVPPPEKPPKRLPTSPKDVVEEPLPTLLVLVDV